MRRRHAVRHIVTVCNERRSWAITDESGRYIGAINELPTGRYEALAVRNFDDDDRTFTNAEEAEDFLLTEANGSKGKL